MKYLILILLFSGLNAEEKIALLIGNNQYKSQSLKNPINDVRIIKQTLLSIGFKREKIRVLKNASKINIEKALSRFSQDAKRADIALVYFSGHGMQINNKNYLFPANTEAKSLIDLYGLVDLNYFIDSASSARYGIVLVDACRNNPFLKYFQNGRTRGAGVKKGLGQVTPKIGQIVVGFATRAGDTADDGIGRNSPYAKYLSKNLKLNLDIRKVLGEVGLDVSKATKGEQNPIIRSTLGRNDVCLSGNCDATNDNQDEIKRLREENKRLRRGKTATDKHKKRESNKRVDGISIGGNFNGDINMNGGDVVRGNKVEVHIK